MRSKMTTTWIILFFVYSTSVLFASNISKTIEVKIGEAVAQKLAKRFGPFLDVNEKFIAAKPTSPLDCNISQALKPGLRYRIMVFDSPEILSFSLPGNIVCFSKGLLSQFDIPHQINLLPFFLQHELYHCEVQSYYPRDYTSLFAGNRNDRCEMIEKVAQEVYSKLISPTPNLKLEKAADFYAALRVMRDTSNEYHLTMCLEKLSRITKTNLKLTDFMTKRHGTAKTRLQAISSVIKRYKNGELKVSASDEDKLTQKAEWYASAIHLHTTFSDGSDNIPQRVAKAKNYGYKVAVITDHNEQIDTLDKDPVKRGFFANPSGFDKGFNDYIRNCDEQSGMDFVAIPGAEVSSSWHAELDTQDSSHILALGPVIQDKELENIQSKLDAQPQIISQLNKLGILSVAAHPRAVTSSSFKTKMWEQSRYRFDIKSPKSYEGIRGIEFFNQTKEQDIETLNWYCTLIKQGKTPFVISGNDSHGWDKAADIASKFSLNSQILTKIIDIGDEDRWNHITWIMTDQLTPKGILDAIENGQTYASRGWAKLTNDFHFPCNSRFVDDGPDHLPLTFTLEFIRCENGRTESFDAPTEVKFIIYRDGKRVSESQKTFAKGTKKCEYSWTDRRAKDGVKHVYFLWVENYLITSPIVFGPSFHLK